MQSLLRVSALTMSTIFFLAVAAWSQCHDPAQPSVVICTPTPSSTVVYIPEVSVRFTPTSGSTIGGMTIYDGSRQMFQGGPGQDQANVWDADVTNGVHNLRVTAWDSSGAHFNATETFYVTGQGYPFCTPPGSPGINFCTPPQNAILGVNTTIGAAATGKTAIQSINFYLNGALQGGCPPNSKACSMPFTLPAQSTPYTVKVVATDSSGNQYTASKTMTAAYTYTEYACFQTCTPGIQINAPPSEAYVTGTFDLNMQIQDNPNPITEMKAYLDNTVIASSSGPALRQQVTVTSIGTHLLTVEGKDDKGIVYQIQENININDNQ